MLATCRRVIADDAYPPSSRRNAGYLAGKLAETAQ
jgi:hypothetical protein